MMELDFQLHKSMPALFNHFLDYTNEEDHSRIQKRFDVLPQTLCFHLTRYFGEADPAHRGRWRFHHLADAVEGIDVEYALPREARPNDEEARYACEAFIVHTGQLKGGHYIAYVKNKGVWWRCNDGRITPISEEDAKKEMKRCYIFFMNRQ
jgi:ubiquitin C-terminal hydrolase